MKTVYDIKKKYDPLAVWDAVSDRAAENRKARRKRELQKEAEARDKRIEAFHAMLVVK